ncbi:MAG: hypothetical protein H0X62_16285, partial [Bacteroidetes bacterium]|nr:hypothetical protein [Bacteroidota bacterium]
MKKLKVYLIFILMCFYGSGIFATHIIGGVVNYECLGNNAYKITLIIYKDCSPGVAPFDNMANLAIYKANGQLHQNLSMPFPGAIKLPGTINDKCGFTAPTNACVEEAIYTTTVTLPPSPGGYNLVHQRCCRNGTIINLINPGNVGATFSAHIPGPEKANCNSNPVYSKLPPIFLCANMELNFDHSAIDIDGDVLVYEICDPFSGGTPNDPIPNPSAPPPYNVVPWIAPYTSASPMASNPVISINAQTGLLTVKPTTIGQWVIGICVKEYRNGILLSEVKRDFQFNVVPCPNLLIADFIIPSNNCSNFSYNFTNSSYNAKTYFWDFGETNLTTDTSYSKDPFYTFSGPGTYNIMLIINPGDACADTSMQTVVVHPILAPDFSVPQPECFTAHNYNFSINGLFTPGANILWNFNNATPPGASTQTANGIKFNAPGTHVVSLFVSENNCSRTITKDVIVHPDVKADMEHQKLFCNGFTYSFTNLSQNATSYLWLFGDPQNPTSTSTLFEPDYTYPDSGTYT